MKLTVTDAAKELGISAIGLRSALQQGKFNQFGEAYKNGKKWTYYINKTRFQLYLKGDLDNENTST